MKISSVMSPCPHQIADEASVDEALEMMLSLEIGHLPVVKGDAVMGVLGRHEANMTRLLCGGESGRNPCVGDLSLRQPLIVSEDAEVMYVVREMADKKISCALVADAEDMLTGIFTTTDACRLVCLLLEEKCAEERV